MKFKDIPDYATRKFVKSRVEKPLEFGLATQLVRRNPDGVVTATYTVIAYNTVFTQVRRNIRPGDETAPSNREWSNDRYDSAEATFDKMVEEITKMYARGYEPVTDGLMVIPFNDTDVQHQVKTKELPAWPLSMVYSNYMNIRAHVETMAASAAAPAGAAPTAAPTPTATFAGSAPMTASGVASAMADHRTALSASI